MTGRRNQKSLWDHQSCLAKPHDNHSSIDLSRHMYAGWTMKALCFRFATTISASLPQHALVELKSTAEWQVVAHFIHGCAIKRVGTTGMSRGCLDDN
jgi:hypothetical protein